MSSDSNPNNNPLHNNDMKNEIANVDFDFVEIHLDNEY